MPASDFTKTEYFAARAAEEWTMSASAVDPRAGAAHAIMANRYERLAAEFDPYRAPQLLPSEELSLGLGGKPSAVKSSGGPSFA